MEREGTVCGGEHDGEPISCEPFGYTPDTMRIWWLPATKESSATRMVASTPMTVP